MKLDDKNNSIILVGNHPASLPRVMPDQLLVYSNLCKPYTVGDSHAPLPRIINLNDKNLILVVL